MPVAFIGPEPLRRKPGPYSELLEAAGYDLVYPSGDLAPQRDELLRLLPGVDLIMAGSEKYTAEVIAAAGKAKIIARTGVGYDAVDVAAATARGIPVTITPGTNHESVAEQAFGLLLAVKKRLARYDQVIRAGGWERDLVLPVRGLTIGLVGMGRIGRAMVPRALAFGMNVIAFDPVHDPEFDFKHGVQRRLFESLLAESDVVSLHLPVTPETRKLFNAETFAKMKRGAVLLNTSRGGLVNEVDLLAALESGQLSGAGLDVFDPEPPLPDNPLLRHKNVVSSPHVGGIDELSMEEMATMAARCMLARAAGEWPVDCMVNPELAK